MQISRAHASLMALMAFAFGMLVAAMLPAMARDIKEWHREFCPRPIRPMRTPTDRPGERQSAQGSGSGKNASMSILPQSRCEEQARERFQLIRGGRAQ